MATSIMKKILILTTILCLLFFKATSLHAQTPEATFVGSSNLQKAEIIRLQIKDDLKLSETKFDSVAVVQKDFQNKSRQIKTDKKLAESIKQKHLKDLADAKSKRLKSAGLDDEELKKVESYFLHRTFP